MVAFADRLREERLRLKLTQAEVAAAAGISPPTQVGYEKGSRSPDVHFLVAIEHLGLDSVYVLTGVPKKKAALAFMDWEFFFELQAMADAWFLAEREITNTRRDSGNITRLLYEILIVDRDSRPERVHSILRGIDEVRGGMK
ncbi:MAG: helix-turn-helix transcriptional regulator [Planctomycetales bacterium]|nr:helix-turn-helix transcriptional regulator [Planctomycetales bacterium]